MGEMHSILTGKSVQLQYLLEIIFKIVIQNHLHERFL